MQTDEKCVRMILMETGEVSTLAGYCKSRADPKNGEVDGFGKDAYFSSVYGVSIDAPGKIALVVRGCCYPVRGWACSHPRPCLRQADTSSYNLIRRIDIASGEVTTVAGFVYQTDSADGIGTNAHFNGPQGVALSADETFALVVRVLCRSQHASALHATSRLVCCLFTDRV